MSWFTTNSMISLEIWFKYKINLMNKEQGILRLEKNICYASTQMQKQVLVHFIVHPQHLFFATIALTNLRTQGGDRATFKCLYY